MGTRISDRMENIGLVVRKTDPKGRRNRLIALTEKAKSLQDDYTRISQQMNEIYYTGFTEIEIIEKIIKAGLQAPTNDHMRDWHYIVIRDKNKAKKLLDIIPKGISDEDMEQLIKD